MATRTWQYTLNPTNGAYMSPFEAPGVKAEILDHIETTGGNREWMTDPVEDGDPLNVLDTLDVIYQFRDDIGSGAFRSANLFQHSGWDWALSGGLCTPRPAKVRVDVSDFNGRHLVAVSVTHARSGRPPYRSLKAHLSPDQEVPRLGAWTEDEIRALVADPTARFPDSAHDHGR